MKSASVAEVKNGLSGYLRAIEKGGEVIVTNRGRPIARLSRFNSDPELSEHERSLVANGEMALAKKPWNPDAILRMRIPSSKASVVEALIEERRNGR